MNTCNSCDAIDDFCERNQMGYCKKCYHQMKEENKTMTHTMKTKTDNVKHTPSAYKCMDCWDDMGIVQLCKLHAAAPKMLEQLKRSKEKLYKICIALNHKEYAKAALLASYGDEAGVIDIATGK